LFSIVNALGVVIGLIIATVGLGLASNFRRIADQLADAASAAPRPPSWLRSGTTETGTIRVFGGVFLVIGVLAAAAALR
jgi:hypothetical protein